MAQGHGDGDRGRDDRPAAPPGMSESDVRARSDLARFLGTAAFPGTRDELLAVARDNGATEDVVARLRSAPAGPFENLQELAEAVGIGTEAERS